MNGIAIGIQALGFLRIGVNDVTQLFYQIPVIEVIFNINGVINIQG
jgi:hypothetical protein